MGIEDSLCPRHLPIIAHTTIHFSQNAVTQLRISCLHLIKLHPNSGILARKGEKDRTYFIRKASHDYLRHSEQNALQLGDRKQTFLTVLGTEIEFVKTHFMGEKNAWAFGNGQMEVNSGIHRVLKLLKCLLFYSSCMTFGLFSLFPLSWRCVLFPLLCPVLTDP